MNRIVYKRLIVWNSNIGYNSPNELKKLSQYFSEKHSQLACQKHQKLKGID